MVSQHAICNKKYTISSMNISSLQSDSSVTSILDLTDKDIALWAEVANIHSA